MEQGLKYHGEVEISFHSKTSMISKHKLNKGEPQLFKIFALFMVNGTRYTLNPPYQLNVVRKLKESQIDSYNSILNNPIEVVKSYTYNGNHTAVMEGSVVYTNLNLPDTATQSLYNYYLVLEDEDGRQLAKTSIPVEDLLNVTPGTEARIKWAMYLSN